jgi:hypothetical protein
MLYLGDEDDPDSQFAPAPAQGDGGMTGKG